MHEIKGFKGYSPFAWYTEYGSQTYLIQINCLRVCNKQNDQEYLCSYVFQNIEAEYSSKYSFLSYGTNGRTAIKVYSLITPLPHHPSKKRKKRGGGKGLIRGTK